jgi:hypothetical protein
LLVDESTKISRGSTANGGVFAGSVPAAIARNLPLLMKGSKASVPAEKAGVRPASRSVNAGL